MRRASRASASTRTGRCRSLPIAHQIQQIYERRLTANVFPGDTSAGQSFVRLEGLVDAFVRAVDRRRDLPPASTILIGEPDALSYDEMQRMLGWLVHGEGDWDTTRIPKAAARAGAWVQDRIPGIEEPFMKPWMIDLADGHYALDISRARRLLGWEPRRTLRETVPRMVERLEADPAAWYRANRLEGPASPRPRPAASSGKRAG